jgi:hypothetical protein
MKPIGEHHTPKAHHKHTHLVQPPANKAHDRDTGHQDRVTTAPKQLEAEPNSGWHTSTYGSPKAPEESASEQQDMTRPEDSAAPKDVGTGVHCAQDAHAPGRDQP